MAVEGGAGGGNRTRMARLGRPELTGRFAAFYYSWGRIWGSPPALPRTSATVVSEPLRMTIVFEQGDDGWIVASVSEVPGAHSQGRTRDEAVANAIDALRGILELRLGGPAEVSAKADSEPLELVIDA